MFSNLTVFKTAHAMAVHAGARQALIAQNVANADTPDYRPRDLPSFAKTFDSQRGAANTGSATAGGMRATRPGHGATLAAVNVADLQPLTEDGADPNRNGVSLEEEMVRGAEVRKDHDRAIAIYRSAMTVLRMSLGSR
ncbi:FlgB family protein [Marinibacterium profundimaris]|uniref:Flagellar basal body rod protein FlgB n=1 Tax=Marinibacterium profundimaris TaxID=1679460 RepID=A0A225NMZ5_9RHOB|nr:FlgB family protein [Marinibacterium profundimaris]OWU75861.1 hypothetical protein ATO3_06665 [Marinibacterium profundimaris]